MSPRRTARHDDGTADPLVALARADPLSPFYDPRYARPLSSTPPDGWGEIDMALLEETRAAVPAFPVDLLPAFWRDWVLDTANATGAPADYVAQSLFAAVAGLCGAGVVVRLGPRWDEPLVLWQALVGPPSSGKSPAMAPMRELLAALDAERDDDAKGALVTEASLSAVADAVTANPRGVVLWRDDPPTWLHTDAVRAPWLPAWSAQTVSFGQGKGQRRIDRFAISLLLACQPHHLADLLAEDREFASRLLFAWPDPPASLRARRLQAGARRRSAGSTTADRDRRAHARRSAGPWRRRARAPHLRWIPVGVARRDFSRPRISRWPGWARDAAPWPGWRASWNCWRGRRWARPFRRVRSAARRPSARCACGPTTSVPTPARCSITACPASASGWPAASPAGCAAAVLAEVSREQVRTEALSRRVDAAEADQVLYRLQDAGVLQQVLYTAPLRGRPPNRWWVNPRLNTTLSAGNTGNAGKS